MALVPFLTDAGWGNVVKPIADPGLSAAVVRDNCARLGLPVPRHYIPVPGYVDAMTGVALGAPGAVPTVGVDRFGLCGVFAGASSQYRQAPAATDFYLDGQMSASCWFKAAGDYTTSQCLFAHAAGASAIFCLTFSVTNGAFAFWNNATAETLISNARVSDDNWRHLLVTRGGVAGAWNMAIYIDGVLDIRSTKTANPSTTGTHTFAVGRFGSYGGYYLRGSLSDIALWDRPMGDGDARALYESSLMLSAPPPRTLYFDLAAGGGTVTSDLATKFDVWNTVTRDLAIQFDLLNTVAADLGIPFDVRQFVVSDEQVVFDIEGSALVVESDLAVLFDMRNVVAQDLAARFDILNSVVSDLGVGYDVRAFTNQDLELTFDIGGMTVSDIQMLFDMAGSVFSDLEVRYSLGISGLKARIIGSSFRRFLS